MNEYQSTSPLHHLALLTISNLKSITVHSLYLSYNTKITVLIIMSIKFHPHFHMHRKLEENAASLIEHLLQKHLLHSATFQIAIATRRIKNNKR